MKKLMIVLALMAVISVAHAEVGDKETYIIKDGNTVRIFHIKDVSKQYYSWKEFEVTNYNCTNISAGDLKSLEVPEGAWKLCSSSESGAYSTKEVKLTDKNKELKDTNEALLKKTQDLQSIREFSGTTIAFLLFVSVCFLISTIVYAVKLKKERAK